MHFAHSKPSGRVKLSPGVMWCCLWFCHIPPSVCSTSAGSPKHLLELLLKCLCISCYLGTSSNERDAWKGASEHHVAPLEGQEGCDKGQLVQFLSESPGSVGTVQLMHFYDEAAAINQKTHSATKGGDFLSPGPYGKKKMPPEIQTSQQNVVFCEKGTW